MLKEHDMSLKPDLKAQKIKTVRYKKKKKTVRYKTYLGKHGGKNL